MLKNSLDTVVFKNLHVPTQTRPYHETSNFHYFSLDVDLLQSIRF